MFRGEDFRPKYKEVSNLRSLIEAPVLAVTATCDEKIKTAIFNTLQISKIDTNIVALTPDR